MPEKRRANRVAPSGVAPRTGKLILPPKTVAVECRVLDISATGARLEIPQQYDFPNRFEFIYGRTRRYCRLAWKRGYRIGIEFDGSVQRTTISRGVSATTSGLSRLSRTRR